MVTRWYSCLAGVITYFVYLEHIPAVMEDMNIRCDAVPTLTSDEQKSVAEFIKVLAEEKRATCQIEWDRKVKMS